MILKSIFQVKNDQQNRLKLFFKILHDDFNLKRIYDYPKKDALKRVEFR